MVNKVPFIEKFEIIIYPLFWQVLATPNISVIISIHPENFQKKLGNSKVFCDSVWEPENHQLQIFMMGLIGRLLPSPGGFLEKK